MYSSCSLLYSKTRQRTAVQTANSRGPDNGACGAPLSKIFLGQFMQLVLACSPLALDMQQHVKLQKGPKSNGEIANISITAAAPPAMQPITRARNRDKPKLSHSLRVTAISLSLGRFISGPHLPTRDHQNS